MSKKVSPWLRRCIICDDKLGNEPVVFVNENVYHARHFKCGVCQQEILIKDSFHLLEKDKVVCIPCFASKFAPICAVCNKGIIDNCVRTAGQHFHQTCFKCKRCDGNLTGECYFDGNGHFVDRDCYWKDRLLKFVANSKQKILK